ncbi:MAG TPA: SUMF1/EgtB/PvdO family nonheme iron enzyme [Anaerolineae bacterium]|nr:SUMF1/EgtB/PvdO family nonheme iron enzyme [Anaerolineae bacterium]
MYLSRPLQQDLETAINRYGPATEADWRLLLATSNYLRGRLPSGWSQSNVGGMLVAFWGVGETADLQALTRLLDLLAEQQNDEGRATLLALADRVWVEGGLAENVLSEPNGRGGDNRYRTSLSDDVALKEVEPLVVTVDDEPERGWWWRWGRRGLILVLRVILSPWNQSEQIQKRGIIIWMVVGWFLMSFGANYVNNSQPPVAVTDVSATIVVVTPATDWIAIVQATKVSAEVQPITRSMPITVTMPTGEIVEGRKRLIDEMVQVWVPGGAFEQGMARNDVIELCQQVMNVGDYCGQIQDNVLPVREVYLTGFWLDQTEVSNEQFARFLAAFGDGEKVSQELFNERMGSVLRYVEGAYRPTVGYETHPVVGVSWYGARAYCEWVGARLPWEVEWEYAARGEAGLWWPWGDRFEAERLSCSTSLCVDDGYIETAPVGHFPQGSSWMGAHDLVGNVWEWVGDSNQYGAGQYVIRGGSWRGGMWPLFGAVRSFVDGDRQADDLGFRCAG